MRSPTSVSGYYQLPRENLRLNGGSLLLLCNDPALFPMDILVECYVGMYVGSKTGARFVIGLVEFD